MAKGFNQVTLIGRLTRDVELRTTGTGKSVASFSLAVDRFTGDEADFFDCVAWEKTADLLQQYTGKGSKILVSGSLQYRTWEQDGNKRSKVEVVARDIMFLDNKGDAPASSAKTNTAKDKVATDVGDEPINLDDIPF